MTEYVQKCVNFKLPDDAEKYRRFMQLVREQRNSPSGAIHYLLDYFIVSEEKTNGIEERLNKLEQAIDDSGRVSDNCS